MKIEKLPSGSYRVRKQINGKRQTKTFDHKPLKSEIDMAFADFVVNAKKPNNKKTFKECAEMYVESKSNVLSPSTLGEYTLKCKRLSPEFTSLPIDEITKADIQYEVNQLSKRLAPKTVADLNGFIQAVLSLFKTDYARYSITLPQKKKQAVYVPTESDIKAIIKESIGTQFEIAIKLGCWGLRRSEICAITADDVDGCVLHINKALVQNKATKEWVIKSTKTTESERDIIIPQELADAIIENGRAYDGFAGSISNWLRRTQDRLGMQHFSLHKERHFFATQLMQMGISQKDIQAMGGWSTSKTLEQIYQHNRISSDQERQRKISSALVSAIS